MIAVGVIAEADLLAGTAQGFAQPVEVVIAALQRAGQISVRVLHVFPNTVAPGVQGVVDAVAEFILDGDQAVCGIVAVTDVNAIRQRGLQQVTGRVIDVAGGCSGYCTGQQPSAGIIGQFSDRAVWIDDRQWPAVGIVIGDFGYLSQGVGDADEIAVIVVIEAGDVVDVGARPVDAGYQAEGIVGICGCRGGRTFQHIRDTVAVAVDGCVVRVVRIGTGLDLQIVTDAVAVPVCITVVADAVAIEV